MRHLPPDGGELVHQIDLETRTGEVKGGLDAADATAYDHDVGEIDVLSQLQKLV